MTDLFKRVLLHDVFCMYSTIVHVLVGRFLSGLSCFQFHWVTRNIFSSNIVFHLDFFTFNWKEIQDLQQTLKSNYSWR